MTDLPIDRAEYRAALAYAFEWSRDLRSFVEKMGDRRQALRERLSQEFDVRDTYDGDDAGMARFLIKCRMKFYSLPDQRESISRIVDLMLQATFDTGGEPEMRSAPAVAAPPVSVPTVPKTTPEPSPEVREKGKDRVSAPVARPPRLEKPENIPAFYTLPLVPDRMPLDPVDLPGQIFEFLLPGPPETADPRTLMLWVSGNLWSSAAVAIGFENPSSEGCDRMAEAENEIYSAPKTIFARPGVLPRERGGDVDRAVRFLDIASRDAGLFSMRTDRAVEIFRDTLVNILRRDDPRRLEGLATAGASIRIGEDAATALACAIDLETFFLQETGNLLVGRAQDLRGSISASSNLVSGLTVQRALCLHLLTGMSLPIALREGLIEFRFAQAQHGVDPEEAAHVAANFDSVFLRDCVEPLSSYRIANNEMEPCF